MVVPRARSAKRPGPKFASLIALATSRVLTGIGACTRMEDDLVCEYDSTWDTESDGDDVGENPVRRSNQDKNKKARTGFWSISSSRNLRAAKDMQTYRHGYPNIMDEESSEERMPNLKFYLNEIKSSPDDVMIETIHSEWKTDYKKLERLHSYIQWLFPLREPGVNYMATELTKKEIQAFRENEEAKRRLVESYELMLGFYGIQLENKETGDVKRAENWRDRFANLERNVHNNLRITRILKSLGELGFKHYQAPLVRFFLEETLVKKNLNNVKRSVLDYFLFAVQDKQERRQLIHFAFQHYEPKDKFVWCPRKIQKRFKKKAEKRQDLSLGNGQSSLNEESCSQSKTKDGERDGKGVEPQKQEASDGITLNSDKFEGSFVDPEPRPEGSSVDTEACPERSFADSEPCLQRSADTEPLQVGTSVDPEPHPEGSSVDPEPLNKEGADNEIEPTNPESSPKNDRIEEAKKDTTQSASSLLEQNQGPTNTKTDNRMDTNDSSQLSDFKHECNKMDPHQMEAAENQTITSEGVPLTTAPQNVMAEKLPRIGADSTSSQPDPIDHDMNLGAIEKQGNMDTDADLQNDNDVKMETDSQNF